MPAPAPAPVPVKPYGTCVARAHARSHTHTLDVALVMTALTSRGHRTLNQAASECAISVSLGRCRLLCIVGR